METGAAGMVCHCWWKPSSTGRVRRIWCQRLRIDGKAVDLGLGSFPVTTLAEARAKALANRRSIEHGQDPRTKVSTVPTFFQAVETVIDLHQANWKNPRVAGQWRASMKEYALPKLGRQTVAAITTSDIMAVLSPIWLEKRETSRKLRQRLGMVMKWAVAKGYRDDNPAGDAIGAALPQANPTSGPPKGVAIRGSGRGLGCHPRDRRLASNETCL